MLRKCIFKHKFWQISFCKNAWENLFHCLVPSQEAYSMKNYHLILAVLIQNTEDERGNESQKN